METETLAKLSAEQSQGLVAIGRKIVPSTNWDYVYGILRDALKDHAPEMRVGLWLTR